MKIKLIAEIGCNHQGKYDQAIEMIKIIKKYCDVDHVKFQKEIQKNYYQKKNLIHPILTLIILSVKHMVYIEKN